MKHFILFTKVPRKSGSSADGRSAWMRAAKEVTEFLSFKSKKELISHIKSLDKDNEYKAYELKTKDPIFSLSALLESDEKDLLKEKAYLLNGVVKNLDLDGSLKAKIENEELKNKIDIELI